MKNLYKKLLLDYNDNKPFIATTEDRKAVAEAIIKHKDLRNDLAELQLRLTLSQVEKKDFRQKEEDRLLILKVMER